MKPPVTLENLMDEWKKDSIIDNTEPGKELLLISGLRSKYLRILSCHNLLVQNCEKEYRKLKRIKWEYYSGDLNNPDDLKAYGWEPWTKRTLRNDIGMYLDSDDDLNKILMKKAVNKEIADCCTDIIKELHSRTFQLKTFVEWHKFTNGA